VNRIDREGAEYCQAFGLAAPGEPVDDPIQNVRVAFAQLANGVAVEFVEPLGAKSPVSRILGRGGGLYHVCYEVQDLAETLARVRQQGGLLVSGPVPARAFGGRRIAFIYTVNHELVEFVEAVAAG
jgi:methylmalonyl-CoA/ethylmalonyl-CoA epimerase